MTKQVFPKFFYWISQIVRKPRNDIIKNALRKLIGQALRNEINELMF